MAGIVGSVSEAVGHVYAQARAEAPKSWEDLGLMQGFPPPPEARVTRENMLVPPFNRWSYQNMGRLAPSIEIPPGDQVRPLVLHAKPLEGVIFNSLSGQRITLEEHLVASRTDAFLVQQDGMLRFERYANGQTPDVRHIMFSVTKSFIGTIAEWLIEKGRLDDTAKVSTYIEALKGSAYGDATVRQVLDMAVGVQFREDYEDPTSEIALYGIACGLGPRVVPEALRNLDSVYTFLPGLKKEREHGGFFHYVTASTEVLGWIIETVTKESTAQWIGKIWRHLGCESAAQIVADPLGRGVAGAGLSATARDLVRFGQMLLDYGRVDQKEVIPESVVRTLLQGADPAIFGANEMFSAFDREISYRSQWYVFAGTALLGMGIHGQMLYVDFPGKTVIVKQSSDLVGVPPLLADAVPLLRTIAREYRP